MHNLMPKGYEAMVATPHYLATAVGSAILGQGGNAFDASVAISAALAVVYPHMTGLGGDAFFLLYDARNRRYIGYNGSGRSAAAATAAHYRRKGMDRIPFRGVDSAITVPGMVDAWWSVWRELGSLEWAALLEPAIRYAENGFPMSRNLAHWIAKDEDLLAGSASLSALYLPSGRRLAEGERLVQKELAATLRAVQREGRNAFYEGSAMLRMTEAIGEDGGLLAADDFREYKGAWTKPLSVSYRGYDVHQMPPNSQGFSNLLMLRMLSHVKLTGIPRGSADFYHLAAEAVKMAFRERDAYLTDPDFRDIPLERLLSEAHASRLWAEVRSGRASDPFASKEMGQDTAYAAVVDREGNAASFIQSLYFDFGACYVPGDTGVLLQNRGSFFDLDQRKPNVLEPRKRSFHTLMPGLVTRDGKPFLLVGTQGGEGQPQTQLSVITGVLDYGLTVQEAIALPRWVYGRTWGQGDDTLKVEARCGEAVVAELKARGHRVEVVGEWDGIMGQAQGIHIDAAGVISGAADPRGDGSAIGW